jgi:beta-lactamase superfamily II metal-dependent hydrolase
MKLPYLIDNISNLSIFVYLIGYPDKGESVVLIIKDKSSNHVLHSCVIDCYKNGTQLKTRDVLNSHNIKHLDVLCWTHTDEDHSIGLDEIINQYCTKKTIFILPEGLTGPNDTFVTYSSTVLNVFNLINNFNSGRNYNLYTASANTNAFNSLKKWEYLDNHQRNLKCEIIAIAPNSTIVRRRQQGGSLKMNEISIALIYRIGGFSFLLSGDIENQTLRLMAKEHLADLSYVKTPHHTSNSSDFLLDIFNEVNSTGYKSPVACSTSYKQHSLPDLGLVNSYKMHSDEFFYTGLLENNDDYGIIEHEFEIGANVHSVKLDGNATKLFP